MNKKLNVLKQKESILTDLEVKTNMLEDRIDKNTKDTAEKIENIEKTLGQILYTLTKTGHK